MFLGVGMLGYLLSVGGAQMLESKAMEVRGLKNIPCENHVLICGFGNLNRTLKLIEELRRDAATHNSDIVIVDDRLEELPRELRINNVHFVRGDAAREPVLVQANLMAARSAIVQADVDSPESSDDRNLKVILAIECFNPDVFTVAECNQPGEHALLPPSQLRCGRVYLGPDRTDAGAGVAGSGHDRYRLATDQQHLWQADLSGRGPWWIQEFWRRPKKMFNHERGCNWSGQRKRKTRCCPITVLPCSPATS